MRKILAPRSDWADGAAWFTGDTDECSEIKEGKIGFAGYSSPAVFFSKVNDYSISSALTARFDRKKSLKYSYNI